MRLNKSIIILIFLFIGQNIIGQNSPINQSVKGCYKLPEGATNSDYQAKTIIFKVKPDFRSSCRNDDIILSDLASVFNYIGANRVIKKFPNHQPPNDEFDNYGHKYADISLIYQMQYSKEIPIEKVINMILSTGKVDYALPRFIDQPLYVPNDPDQNSQFYLKSIKAYQAWDISQGDTNIVIGITDSGTDLDHPDLINSIKYNYLDPIDGIDNDNDGYTDNFHGWDIGENDNNPNVNMVGHGVHVSGISSATVDDGIGMAGVGYRTKFMAVKVDDEYGSFQKTYEAVVYAADHGCDIINCSWGGKFGEGQFGQDIITYATINQNCLVVAACGNDNNENTFWPASYKYVLSVAATDSMDVKWDGSSYGKNIDISAPGTFIYSTWNGGYYVTSHGTSMAAPIVSACAAIVKAQYPNLTALQIGEQLKTTADNIDTVNGNQAYAEKLGAGRANLYSALTISDKPSVRLLNLEVLEVYDSISFYDTMDVKCEFINYLAPTSNLNVSLTSTSNYVQIVPGNLNLDTLQTLQSKNNYSAPFKIVVFPNIPDNHYVEFKLTYTDSSYQAVEYFSHIFHPEFLNINTEYISTTLTSNSRMAYNDNYYSQGIGFTYKNGVSLISTAGLVVGSSGLKVSDNIVGVAGYDSDFSAVQKINSLLNPIICDNAYRSVFSDSLSTQSKLDIRVIQDVYTCDSAQDAKYIIYEYKI
ncbi:MAG: S8 family serine peptidase, partial [Bacteroidetes bacterium]|nr:S8 family serine peptidase [Bacteroidota bacterium]